VLEVVFAAFCAFCCRPRACPPFLAAALRLADDERELEAVERELADERLLLAEERLLPERLDPLDFLDLPPELPLLRRSAICFPSWSH
jgi:hypothetical protein